MRIFLAIVLFDLRASMRRISTHVYFAIYLGLGLLMAAVAGGAFKEAAVAMGGAGGIVHGNAPAVIFGLTGACGIFAVPVITAIMGNAAYRDMACGIHPLVFTCPLSKATYLSGRFVGALLVNAWIFLSIPLGLLAGYFLPGLMEDRMGPFRFATYVVPYVLLLMPTLLFVGATFFALAAFTRKMLPNYLGGVVLLVGYLLSTRLLGDMDNKIVAALVDPFGMSAFRVATEYWTAAEKNTLLAPAWSVLGLNRLLWLCGGLVVFVLCAWRFRFAHVASEGPGRAGRGSLMAWLASPFAARGAAAEPEGANVGLGIALRLPDVARDASWRAHARQFLAVFRRAFASIALNVYFPAIAGAGLVFLVFASGQVGKLYGTPTWPVTYQVLEVLGGTFAIFTLVILAFYAGELVWQERDLKVQQITDSLPAPSWALYLGKLAALVAVVAGLQLLVIVAGALTQTAKGYSNIEFGLYLKVLLGLNLGYFLLWAIFAFLVHVVVNQKYAGHLAVILCWVGVEFSSLLGIQHNMLKYASDPGWQYSDMNSFGPFLAGVGWFRLYWASIAAMFAVLAGLLWVRGQETHPAWRLRLARTRFAGSSFLIGVSALALALAAGGWIFYNTNVRNDYTTQFERQELQAEYERTYKKHEGLPQPRLTGVSVEADLHPKEGRADFRGTLRLANKTSDPITQIHVLMPAEAEVRLLEFDPPATLEVEDEPQGYRIFRPAEPLPPGAALTCRFDIAYSPEGFANGGPQTAVVENGTFVNSRYLPSFGYQANYELSDDDTRRKHGLEPKERMHAVDDMAARMNTYISSDADWIAFDATVSTDPDQTAIAPGYLEREWIEDGRRHFRYTMDIPILNFYSFLSARYEIRKDDWNGLPIEIYYHRGHEYNLDGMIQAVKKSLDYYTTAFGPYQHSQVRILEFPRYATFAQSFPNTIPFSEGIGFIARLDAETNIDYPFYVTAHEIAHQWWAHQVIGGNVQGSTLLSESLSQYSALMVMEREFGKDQMRKFLKHELNSYLTGRAFERKKELPLALNENQTYIHYNKGSVAMYALRDYLGEETLNGAIRGYLERVRYQEPPYTNSLEFVDAIRAVTPPELAGLVDDLFMTITLWDLRAKDATIARTAGGEWEVTLAYEARKYRADETGNQTEEPLDMPIDVGVFAEGDTSREDDDVPLVLEKHRVVSGEGTITLVVDRKPARAGIDPYHKLIDRKSSDNVVKVKEAAPPAS